MNTREAIYQAFRVIEKSGVARHRWLGPNVICTQTLKVKPGITRTAITQELRVMADANMIDRNGRGKHVKYRRKL